MLFTLRKFGILREINFAELKMTKSAILRILEMLDFDIWEISDRKKLPKFTKIKIQSLENSQIAVFTVLEWCKI